MRQVVRTAVMVAALISLAGAGFKFPSRADASFPVTLSLSPAVMDFDEGLDVRDELGRSVKSAVARLEFRQLFVSTVFQIMTRAELPQMAAFLAALDKTWDLFLFAFARPVAQAWRSFVDLGLPTSRKGQGPPLLAIVSAIFASLIFLRFRILDNSSRTESLLTCLSSTVIRC